MDDTTIEGLEGQLLQGAVALMLRWSDLHLGPGEWGEVLLGMPPAEFHRAPVPPYHASLDACFADIVPFLRQAPRGFEVTIATEEQGEALPYCVVWFTRCLGEDEIEVCARVGGKDLAHTVSTALCRAALKAHERVTGNGESAIA